MVEPIFKGGRRDSAACVRRYGARASAERDYLGLDFDEAPAEGDARRRREFEDEAREGRDGCEEGVGGVDGGGRARELDVDALGGEEDCSAEEGAVGEEVGQEGFAEGGEGVRWEGREEV